MNILGNIADSILIGGACIAADIECAFSSIGISKRAREVGKNTNKDNKSNTDRAPSNPPQNPNTTAENDSAVPPKGYAADKEIPISKNDGPVKNNYDESDPPKKNKKDTHKKDNNPEKPPAAETKPAPKNEEANVTTDDVAAPVSVDNNTNPANDTNADQMVVKAEGGVDAAMNSRPFMTTTNDGRIAVDLSSIATGGASNNAFRENGQDVNNTPPMAPNPVPQIIPYAHPFFPNPGFAHPMVTHPLHVQNVNHGMSLKVDQPKKPRPVKLPRNPDETKIDDSTKQAMEDMVHIQPSEPNVTIDESGFVPNVPNPDTTPEKPISKFKNNQIIISNYPFMEEVEAIALENGYQIEFRYFDKLNIITACIYDGNSMTLIDGKGFVIDLGSIIDRRKKVFLGLPTIFERLPAYHMFMKPDKNGGKSKLNREFFKTIIVGGNAAAANVKPMYSKEFVDLNAHVALITMNSFNLHPDDRRYIQTRLVDALNAGIFGEVRHVDRLTRFRIADFDKKTKTIVLDSAGVPLNYGHDFTLHPRHQVIITEKDMTIKHSDFVEVPE